MRPNEVVAKELRETWQKLARLDNEAREGGLTVVYTPIRNAIASMTYYIACRPEDCDLHISQTWTKTY